MGVSQPSHNHTEVEEKQNTDHHGGSQLPHILVCITCDFSCQKKAETETYILLLLGPLPYHFPTLYAFRQVPSQISFLK